MEILRYWRLTVLGLIVLFSGLLEHQSVVQPQAGIGLPSGFSSSLVAGPFSTPPTAMAIAPDGRVFVLGQYGVVYVISNGELLSTPFAAFNVNVQGERGLLGIAFDPDFANNNYVYFYYTVNGSPLHNRIVRVTANGNVMQAGSEVLIYQLDNLDPSKNIHNGGAISFSPTDGRNLYIATGENNTASNAQLLTSSMGKILRITVNTNGTVNIPASNPFNDGAGPNNDAIWAYGLRNPFVIAFQPGTGRLFINDVGEWVWEEINDGIVGSNYGWPTTEGPTTNPSFQSPICGYPHPASSGLIGSAPCVLTPQTTTVTGCAITGGAFYNPSSQMFPSDYVGDYFFMDYCDDWIKRYDIATNRVLDFATTIGSDSIDMEVASDGSIYYLARGTSSTDGRLYRITYSGGGNLPPTITQHPTNRTIAEGETAQFTCAASGTAPLSYQWQRKNSGAGSFSNISGATSGNYTTPATVAATDDQAQFRCQVTNSFGSANSNPATLTVQINQRPSATITTPTSGTLFTGGQTITFSGTGTDPEDVTIPASGYTWEVELHHVPAGQSEHLHPTMMPVSGITTGSFMISNDHGNNDHFYRIILTVEDSQGLTYQATRDIYPQVVTINILTQPTGLQATVDSQPQTTPYNSQWVVNFPRSIGAITPQILNNLSYVFQNWSDGGAATHTVTTPATNTTYTLTYAQQPAITQQPANATVNEGQTAQFSCLASGTAPLTYQWQRRSSGAGSFSNIGGATSSSYTTPVTTIAADDQAQFRCVVTNAYGNVTSNAATLTVQGVGPTITQHPTDISVLEGQTAQFSCAASGTAPISYQWQRKNSGAASFSDIGSATSTTYTTPVTVVANDNGAEFRCRATNAYGSANSNAATLTVQLAGVGPSFTQQPSNTSTFEGQTAQFSCLASGTAPLSYQWQRKNSGAASFSNIGGATSSSYTTPATTIAADDQAQFRCVVTNAYGNATSNAATLTVNGNPPTITQHPASTSVTEGQTAQFNCASTGSGTLSYQWQRKNSGAASFSNIGGATSTSYTTPATVVGADDQAQYRCRVTNAYGSANSNPATLTVQGIAPSITQHPASLVIGQGETAQFTCAASGTVPRTFQWQRKNNGVGVFNDISGATSTTYTTGTTTVATDNQAQFRCRVTNAYGSATSNPATLTVQSNQRPTAAITTPASGTRFTGGQVISFSGTGTDPEQGALPASAYTWKVELYHTPAGGSLNIHTIVSPVNGITSGSFNIQNDHGDDDHFYRITLTVQDSGGLVHTVHRDIYPRVVTIQIRTQPTGLQVNVDGQPYTTPLTYRWVVGITRSLEAFGPQTNSNGIYVFQKWSDNGAANHNIVTPDVDTTYTATFVPGMALPNYYTVSNPTLTWNPIPWARAYHIQVDNNSNFSSPEYDNQTISPGTSSIAPPLGEGVWYWRVRALRSDQTWGTWSSTGSFTIDLP